MTRTVGWAILAAALTGGLSAGPQTEKGGETQVKGAVLKLIEQVDLPARDAGVLAMVEVREGEAVTQGQKIAQLDDRVARLAAHRAEVDVDAARHNAERSTAISLAKKRAEREEQRSAEQRSQARISDRLAENRIALQIAERTRDVASASLKRGKQSREKSEKSISDKELDQYQLAYDKALLEVEQATFDLETAKMRAQAQWDVVRGQELTAESFGLEIEDAEADQQYARIQQKLKEEDLRIRMLSLEFQELRSPIDGVVVERYRSPGEWVEPGERVLRIVHLKRLRAEGFLNYELADERLLGRTARFLVVTETEQKIARTGKIVHVGSEIEPVSRQVKVWAEIDNDDQVLRPGMQGTLIIDAPPTAR